MREELQEILITKYPGLCAEHGGDPMRTCMAWGFEVGDGWFDLLDRTLGEIEEADPEAVLTQVKEKFGCLRIYLQGNDPAYDAAERAETRSAEICELCGAPGKLRPGGWIVTRCGGCL